MLSAVSEQTFRVLGRIDRLVVEHSDGGNWDSFSVVLLKHFQQIPNLTRTIVELCLQVRHWSRNDSVTQRIVYENNYVDVCGIASKCRGVKQLALMNWGIDLEYHPQSSLLRQLAELVGQEERVPLEKMKLKYIQDDTEFQTFTGPLFQALRSLTLEFVRLTPIFYRALLAASHRHLDTLKLEGSNVGDQSVLPVQLPNLKSLYITSLYRSPVMFPADFDMLSKYPALNYVYVAIEPAENDERVLLALSQLPAKIEISLGPTDFSGTIPRILERYGDNIVRLVVNGRQITSEIATLIANRCSNLTALLILHRTPTNAELTYDLLQTFLNDESRAMKLRELGTVVPYSAEVVQRIFEVCRNLTGLYLYPKDDEFHPASFMGLLDDDQVQLSVIRLAYPTGLTDDTLWPLLQRCGIRLKRIYVGDVFDRGNHKLTRKIYDLLFEHCRMVEDFGLVAYKDLEQQNAVKEIAFRKLFRKVIVN